MNRLKILHKYVLIVDPSVTAKRMNELINTLGPGGQRQAFYILKEDYISELKSRKVDLDDGSSEIQEEIDLTRTIL